MVDVIIFLILILIVIILAIVGRFIMLMLIHLFNFLVSDNKNLKRFKNMVIYTFWQTLCFYAKADKYKWR